MPNTGIRLNKALADAGLCSRRKADELIASGAVRVNGTQVREMGLRVDPEKDIIEVSGKRLPVPQAGDEAHTYVVLHKPIQVVSTARDPDGRETVLDILPPIWRNKRLYPVGRLDYFSEGLILLTDDGGLTHRLTHPRFHLPKVYEVRVRESVSPEMIARMRQGMTLAEGEKLAPVEARMAGDTEPVLELVLYQGINRQIRRMCRDLGLTILSLKRVGFGPLVLGALPKGQCRVLEREEINALLKAAGLKE